MKIKKTFCDDSDELRVDWIENQILDDIDEEIKELKIRKEHLLNLFERKK